MNLDFKNKKEEKTNNLFFSLLGVILIIVSISFVSIGTFKLIYALLTDYNLHSIDLLYFTSGILILFSIGILNLVSEIKDQNKTIAKGVLHLLKTKLNNEPKPTGVNFQETLKNLFKRTPGMSDDDVSGSISIYNADDPDNPIFSGDFKNMEEMNEIRKQMLDKMLNSHQEFKGKKMTKQEMLNSLSLRELKSELKLAVDSEDWLWAASIRDKISEKENNKKKGNPGSEKKDN